MNIFIDTYYFLPFVKIGIKNIPQNVLINLFSKTSNNYYYSDLSIFEITATALKIISQENGEITPQDIRVGIDAIQHDSRLNMISYTQHPFIIELSSEFRSIHNDTIDCLIFATAICTCDCIITMDVSFYDHIKKNSILIKKIKEINENFKFWFNDLSNELKSLEM